MATCCKCLSINKNHCLLFCAVLPPGNLFASALTRLHTYTYVYICMHVCICCWAEV